MKNLKFIKKLADTILGRKYYALVTYDDGEKVQYETRRWSNLRDFIEEEQLNDVRNVIFSTKPWEN